MLNHDQQTAAAWFSHFTQINGSFQSSWTQKGIPWLRRKELLDYFFFHPVAVRKPPVSTSDDCERV